MVQVRSSESAACVEHVGGVLSGETTWARGTLIVGQWWCFGQGQLFLPTLRKEFRQFDCHDNADSFECCELLCNSEMSIDCDG